MSGPGTNEGGTIGGYPDIRPKPKFTRHCKVCERTLMGSERVEWIVSPSGVEHIGVDGGDTACGKDATGLGWWWPL